MSVVIGAILIVGILVTMLVTATLKWAPVWQANAEASHAVTIDAQLLSIGSQIWAHGMNTTSGSAGSPLMLGPGRTPIMGGGALPSTLSFRAAESTFQVAASRLTMFEANGTLLAPGEDQWASFPASVTIQDVGELLALRLRVAQVSAALSPRAVTVALTDADDAFAGSYRLRTEVKDQTLLVIHEVRDRNNALITSVPDPLPQSFADRYFSNVLADDYAFNQVVAVASKPLHVLISYDPGFNTDYAVVYRHVDPSGASMLSASGGVLKAPYLATFDAGALALGMRNRAYPTQTFRTEYGALIVEQPEGAVFRAPPRVSAFRLGTTSVLEIQISGLEGADRQISGTHVLTVSSERTGGAQFSGSSPDLLLNLTTSYPQLWSAFFDAELKNAGLSPAGSQPQFRVTTGASQVRVEVFGLDADPSSTVHDIHTSFTRSEVELSIKP